MAKKQKLLAPITTPRRMFIEQDSQNLAEAGA
jgi:hypothetical protein